MLCSIVSIVRTFQSPKHPPVPTRLPNVLPADRTWLKYSLPFFFTWHPTPLIPLSFYLALVCPGEWGTLGNWSWESLWCGCVRVGVWRGGCVRVGVWGWVCGGVSVCGWCVWRGGCEGVCVCRIARDTMFTRSHSSSLHLLPHPYPTLSHPLTHTLHPYPSPLIPHSSPLTPPHLY